MASRHRGPVGTLTARPGTCRGRILEYIASQGGELRSDSGTGLRRRVADALGERPTTVGQALLGLERTGLIEREVDVARHRCHAIRLVTADGVPAPDRQRPRQPRSDGYGWGLGYAELRGQLRALADVGDETAAYAEMQVERATKYLRADHDRLSRRLAETEHELGDAIRRGVELARRIEALESILAVTLSDQLDDLLALVDPQ